MILQKWMTLNELLHKSGLILQSYFITFDTMFSLFLFITYNKGLPNEYWQNFTCVKKLWQFFKVFVETVI